MSTCVRFSELRVSQSKVEEEKGRERAIFGNSRKKQGQERSRKRKRKSQERTRLKCDAKSWYFGRGNTCAGAPRETTEFAFCFVLNFNLFSALWYVMDITHAFIPTDTQV